MRASLAPAASATPLHGDVRHARIAPILLGDHTVARRVRKGPAPPSVEETPSARGRRCVGMRVAKKKAVLPASTSMRSSSPSATASDRCRVLLVDDEALLRQRLARALVRHGFEVVSVASVVAACHWLRHGEFDVVVTEVCLHDGTGFDVFAAARGARVELPVLFVGSDPGLPSTLATP